MEPERLVRCPLCDRDLPESAFGICRSRRLGRNLYDKACIRKKVTDSRRALKEFKRRRREILEAQSEPLFAELPPVLVRKLSPVERVVEAITNGAKTQTEIRSASRLSDDEVGDALADLFSTRELRTEMAGDDRVYFLNKKSEVIRKPSLPASFSTVKGLMPVMKGKRKIGGWIAA